jgi:hypothetical protein
MNAEREMLNDEHCRMLWLVVLIRAVNDTRLEREGKPLLKEVRGCDHRDFLNGGGSFEQVCAFLDYNPEYTIRKAKEMLELPEAKYQYLIRDLRGWL